MEILCTNLLQYMKLFKGESPLSKPSKLLGIFHRNQLQNLLKISILQRLSGDESSGRSWWKYREWFVVRDWAPWSPHSREKRRTVTLSANYVTKKESFVSVLGKIPKIIQTHTLISREDTCGHARANGQLRRNHRNRLRGSFFFLGIIPWIVGCLSSFLHTHTLTSHVICKNAGWLWGAPGQGQKKMTGERDANSPGYLPKISIFIGGWLLEPNLQQFFHAFEKLELVIFCHFSCTHRFSLEFFFTWTTVSPAWIFTPNTTLFHNTLRVNWFDITARERTTT